MEAGLFDALLDLSKWLTPEVILSGIGVLIGGVTLFFVLRERRERRMDRQPRVSLDLSRGSTEGWHSCTIDAMNRTDSTVLFTKATAPRGFLMGRAADIMAGTPIPETIGNVVQLDWHLNAGPGSPLRHGLRLLIKRDQRSWFSRSKRSIKLSFNITVHDANRREQVVKAITSSINWAA